MASRDPLTKQQRQAADLLGRGWKQRTVAAEVGTSHTSIRRWLKRDDFRALVAESRARREQAPSSPSIRAVFEDAMTATKDDGTPDHSVRIKAAQELRKLDGAAGGATDEPAAQPEPTFYDEDNDE